MMRLDGTSWLIWLIGLAIFIIWIVFPLREFVNLIKERMRK
jgi:hypothetical protein